MTARTGLEPVPELNVPVTVSAAAGMLNVQAPAVTVHDVGAPLQLPKDELTAGEAVKVI